MIKNKKRIRGRVKSQMKNTQREYYLNEEMKAIQKEFGEIEVETLPKYKGVNTHKRVLKSKDKYS